MYLTKTIIPFYLLIVFLTLSCSYEDDYTVPIENDLESNSENTSQERKCGFHNDNQLWTGPQGGCYYYNSNQNKTYVDRSECNC